MSTDDFPGEADAANRSAKRNGRCPVPVQWARGQKNDEQAKRITRAGMDWADRSSGRSQPVRRIADLILETCELHTSDNAPLPSVVSGTATYGMCRDGVVRVNGQGQHRGRPRQVVRPEA